MSKADFSKITELLETKRLYEDAEHRHAMEIAERDTEIALVVNEASDVSGWLGLLWMVSIIACITVYTVGTVFFRRSTMAPSRRMERWLRSGSRTTASSDIPEPAADEGEESVAVLVDVTQDASAPTTTTSAYPP